MPGYLEGQTLALQLGSGNETIHAKVLHLYEPFTLSCVSVVEISGSAIGSTANSARAILKLYDRRFAIELRDKKNTNPWSEETERTFYEYVAHGQADTFIHTLSQDESRGGLWDEAEEDWSPEEDETFLHTECSKLFTNETTAYEHLRELQGTLIPKFYSTIRLPLSATTPQDNKDLYSIKGILIEYIPGRTLYQMAHTIPQKHWTGLVEQACQIVRSYHHLPVFNKGLGPWSFIVTEIENENSPSSPPTDMYTTSPSPSTFSHYRVVMFDFARCWFRDSSVEWKFWARRKASEDEIGMVGCVMGNRLRGRHGFDIGFKREREWDEYKEGEEGFPDEEGTKWPVGVLSMKVSLR